MAQLSSPRVVWITGLSGSGKTTVAGHLRELCIEAGTRPVMLDGDSMRRIVGGGVGYSGEERRGLAFLYGRLALEIASQGHIVIVATISLFGEVHAWNREHLPGYCEVWLRVPDDELVRRDNGRLYGADAASRGLVAGLDLAVEFPNAPDLTIDNFGATTPDIAARRIFQHLTEACE